MKGGILATPFTNIYELAISQYIDDFALKRYGGSLIAMDQDLQSFLMAAVPEFNIPISIIPKIQDYTKASGTQQTFSGNGVTSSFVLSSEPIENSFIEVAIDGSIVTNYVYNNETFTVTFDVAPAIGTDNISISWYFVGEFTNDLNMIEQSILSDLMIWKWLLRERDNIADIRRLLRDTDYQLWSEDKTMTSKANLSDIAREKAQKSMKQYGWSIYSNNINSDFALPNYAKVR